MAGILLSCLGSYAGLAAKLNNVVCAQERPEAVPTGELPQSMTLIVDRHLVGKISPGTRVTAIGIYSIYQVHNYKLHPVLSTPGSALTSLLMLPTRIESANYAIDILLMILSDLPLCHLITNAGQ
jgi:hypothetical protein